MANSAEEVLRTFPPRPLSPEEHALVASWLAATCGAVSGYVCERRSDDPAHYRRIVVTVVPDVGPSYLIHAPTGMSCWLVTQTAPGSDVRRFDSLRAALDSIRPVLLINEAGCGR
jgi:hypothetical protein